MLVLAVAAAFVAAGTATGDPSVSGKRAEAQRVCGADHATRRRSRASAQPLRDGDGEVAADRAQPEDQQDRAARSALELVQSQQALDAAARRDLHVARRSVDAQRHSRRDEHRGSRQPRRDVQSSLESGRRGHERGHRLQEGRDDPPARARARAQEPAPARRGACGGEGASQLAARPRAATARVDQGRDRPDDRRRSGPAARAQAQRAGALPDDFPAAGARAPGRRDRRDSIGRRRDHRPALAVRRRRRHRDALSRHAVRLGRREPRRVRLLRPRRLRLRARSASRCRTTPARSGTSASRSRAATSRPATSSSSTGSATSGSTSAAGSSSTRRTAATS